MKRISTILSITVLTLVGVGLFHVAQNVRDYEGQLKSFNSQITFEKETIHTLQAEWHYLNQPGRLEKLAEKHTDLKPISEKNLIALSNIPFIAQETDDGLDGDMIAQPKPDTVGHNSYISKTKQKTRTSLNDDVTLPVHNVSLRDIWGQ